jgi:hypothetical protein
MSRFLVFAVLAVMCLFIVCPADAGVHIYNNYGGPGYAPAYVAPSIGIEIAPAPTVFTYRAPAAVYYAPPAAVALRVYRPAPVVVTKTRTHVHHHYHHTRVTVRNR